MKFRGSREPTKASKSCDGNPDQCSQRKGANRIRPLLRGLGKFSLTTMMNFAFANHTCNFSRSLGQQAYAQYCTAIPAHFYPPYLSKVL